jgi:UDP-2-acetamido-2,6-beta-L-arabino-hexul-4-ose reductase
VKVLVTGSDGFIGKNLLVKLAENSIEFVCFTRRQSTDELVNLLKDIDFVFHLAGVNRPSDPAEFTKQNYDLTSALCDAIQKTGRSISVVFTSSLIQYRASNLEVDCERQKEPASQATSI